MREDFHVTVIEVFPKSSVHVRPTCGFSCPACLQVCSDVWPRKVETDARRVSSSRTSGEGPGVLRESFFIIAEASLAATSVIDIASNTVGTVQTRENGP